MIYATASVRSDPDRPSFGVGVSIFMGVEKVDIPTKGSLPPGPHPPKIQLFPVFSFTTSLYMIIGLRATSNVLIIN